MTAPRTSLLTNAKPSEPRVGDLFERLLQANHDGFAFGRFNTAYHALAAAMHEAKAERHSGRLEQVARLAEEELLWIDANAGDYEHSTESCLTRRSTSLYTLLAQQARTNERLLALSVNSR